MLSDHAWLRKHRFVLPKSEPPSPESASLLVTSSTSVVDSCLRQELNDAQHLLENFDLTNLASDADAACKTAFRNTEEASWNVCQDSMLTYGQSLETPLDVVEHDASADSKITSWVSQPSGQARRFTRQDGDLCNASGQRDLWELLRIKDPTTICLVRP